MQCFKCDKPLERVMDDLEDQPYAATSFQSYGQYGSTVFDPMNGSEHLLLHICDECLLANSKAVKHMFKTVNVTYKGEVWAPEVNPE